MNAKQQTVLAHLEQAFEHGLPHQTINDIAEATGVHYSSVRRAVMALKRSGHVNHTPGSKSGVTLTSPPASCEISGEARVGELLKVLIREMRVVGDEVRRLRLSHKICVKNLCENSNASFRQNAEKSTVYGGLIGDLKVPIFTQMPMNKGA